ncbi:MAG: HPr family phosphocarrier protein [Sciscionella sp.]
MPVRKVVVASKVGLHARPAAVLAKAAATATVPVTIAKEGGTPVAAGSMLNLMTLGAAHGDTVILTAEGDGAEETLDELAQIVATDLDA